MPLFSGCGVDINQTVTFWLQNLKAGDEQAVNQIWQRYFGRVVALAKSRLAARHRKVADEEDLALSVFDSFCRGVTVGKYPNLTDRNGLWPLLAIITIRKAADRVAYESRQIRGSGRVQAEADLKGDGPSGFNLNSILNSEPTPEVLAIMDEECERLFSKLDDDQRRIAQGKLQGYTNQELADQMNCGLRTIERRLDLIRRVWEKAIGDATSD